MAFSAIAIANEFLKLAERDHVTDVTPMKLLKLVYYAQGWHLAIENQPLIDEQIEAWQYGPVVPSLFHEFKQYGNQPITELAETIIDDPESPLGEFHTPTLGDDDSPGTSDPDFTRRLIERVWDEYGSYSASKLSNMTHEPNGPWDQVCQCYGGNIPKATDIDTDIIKSHFRDSLERHLSHGS